MVSERRSVTHHVTTEITVAVDTCIGRKLRLEAQQSKSVRILPWSRCICFSIILYARKKKKKTPRKVPKTQMAPDMALRNTWHGGERGTVRNKHAQLQNEATYVAVQKRQGVLSIYMPLRGIPRFRLASTRGLGFVAISIRACVNRDGSTSSRWRRAGVTMTAFPFLPLRPCRRLRRPLLTLSRCAYIRLPFI